MQNFSRRPNFWTECFRLMFFFHNSAPSCNIIRRQLNVALISIKGTHFAGWRKVLSIVVIAIISHSNRGQDVCFEPQFQPLCFEIRVDTRDPSWVETFFSCALKTVRHNAKELSVGWPSYVIVDHSHVMCRKRRKFSLKAINTCPCNKHEISVSLWWYYFSTF